MRWRRRWSSLRGTGGGDDLGVDAVKVGCSGRADGAGDSAIARRPPGDRETFLAFAASASARPEPPRTPRAGRARGGPVHRAIADGRDRLRRQVAAVDPQDASPVTNRARAHRNSTGPNLALPSDRAGGGRGSRRPRRPARSASVSGVAIQPGATAFTRTRGAQATASERTSATTPPLLAAYGGDAGPAHVGQTRSRWPHRAPHSAGPCTRSASHRPGEVHVQDAREHLGSCAVVADDPREAHRGVQRSWPAIAASTAPGAVTSPSTRSTPSAGGASAGTAGLEEAFVKLIGGAEMS